MMDDTPRMYYRLWYRLDGADSYLIWYSNDHDGVVIDPDGTVPSFHSFTQLYAYAAAHQIEIVKEEPLLHDLDHLAAWLVTPFTDIDCDVFLAAWNLFGDISLSVGGHFEPDQQQTQHIYGKLFWGNNLPAMTPPGEHYTPEWTDDEVKLMKDTLSYGLQLFRKVVRQV
jgi:hypothetical protein